MLHRWNSDVLRSVMKDAIAHEFGVHGYAGFIVRVHGHVKRHGRILRSEYLLLPDIASLDRHENARSRLASYHHQLRRVSSLIRLLVRNNLHRPPSTLIEFPSAPRNPDNRGALHIPAFGSPGRCTDFIRPAVLGQIESDHSGSVSSHVNVGGVADGFPGFSELPVQQRHPRASMHGIVVVVSRLYFERSFRLKGDS